MVKHELYINDILVDIDKDVNIYPLYQSPLLTDLKSIVSNRTNNISLPMTPQNVKAIQMFHLADTTDEREAFPRKWSTVRYYRNGFNICSSGQGMLTGISGGRINFSFTWGASSKLQNLFDKKLTDLSLPTDINKIPWKNYSAYGYCHGYSDKIGYFMIDFGAGIMAGNFNANHPCLTSNYILELIETNNKIKFDKNKISTRYLLPCLKRPNDTLNEPSDYFNIKECVPDMTQADFLKGIMQLHGVFAYLKDEDTIGFLSFKDVLNSTNHYDWTDKVISSSNVFSVPDTMEFDLDGFAQRNIFKYASDKDAEENGTYDGYIYVNNQTITRTKDSVKSPFCYTKNSNNGLTAIIGLYEEVYEDGKFIIKSINNNLKPRILKIRSGDYVDFLDELKWSNILNNDNYKAYRQVVETPRVLKVKCLLTDWDLAHIDFAFPVLLRQFGHFYAIIKIQTKAGGICDCSFLEIK